MDTAPRKRKDTPSAKAETKPLATTVAANGPVKVFRIDEVSVSLFARQRQYQGKPAVFYSASSSRSYKDAAGERKYAKNFDGDDLGKVVELAQRASEYVRSLTEPSATAEL